ncbi:MAG: glycosyltransferase and protein, partial [Solirubrobacterales bacterium]|nr:glycosyltransferase and protein [Solirubrobacterales bacterium]
DTLACLRGCGIGRLYVFADGPRNAGDTEGVAGVREVINGIDWTETVIVEHPENRGLSASIQAGLDMVFARHDAAVVIEDDIQVSPEFFAYACAALEHYASSQAVAGVTGLRLPFDPSVLTGYPYDVFLSPRFSSWAWATWRDRWQSFDFDAASLRRRIAAGGLEARRAGADMPRMIDQAVVKETLGGAWDTFCATNMLLSGQSFITPAWNMVDYAGYEDGTHHSGEPDWKLHWEAERRPSSAEEIRFAPAEPDQRVLRAYLDFLDPPGVRAAIRRLLRRRPPAGAGRPA